MLISFQLHEARNKIVEPPSMAKMVALSGPDFEEGPNSQVRPNWNDYQFSDWDVRVSIPAKSLLQICLKIKTLSLINSFNDWKGTENFRPWIFGRKITESLKVPTLGVIV